MSLQNSDSGLAKDLRISMISSPGTPVELDVPCGSISQVPLHGQLIAFTTSPGAVYCFNTPEEDAEFWKNTVVAYINETISGKFDQRDYDELYSQADLTEQKFKTFTAGCQSGPSGENLKYLGTSSTIRDLVSLGDAIIGQDQPINYWGISYGTVIGFNFINSELRDILVNLRLKPISSVPRGRLALVERQI